MRSRSSHGPRAAAPRSGEYSSGIDQCSPLTVARRPFIDPIP